MTNKIGSHYYIQRIYSLITFTSDKELPYWNFPKPSKCKTRMRIYVCVLYTHFPEFLNKNESLYSTKSFSKCF